MSFISCCFTGKNRKKSSLSKQQLQQQQNASPQDQIAGLGRSKIGGSQSQSMLGSKTNSKLIFNQKNSKILHQLTEEEYNKKYSKIQGISRSKSKYSVTNRDQHYTELTNRSNKSKVYVESEMLNFEMDQENGISGNLSINTFFYTGADDNHEEARSAFFRMKNNQSEYEQYEGGNQPMGGIRSQKMVRVMNDNSENSGEDDHESKGENGRSNRFGNGNFHGDKQQGGESMGVKDRNRASKPFFSSEYGRHKVETYIDAENGEGGLVREKSTFRSKGASRNQSSGGYH